MAILNDNMRGALLMMGAMTAYTLNDVFIKLALADIPLFQAILLRGVGAVLFLLVLCHWLGQLRFDLPREEWWLIALRTSGEVAGTYFFLTALWHMPIANVTAVMQALPLTVSLAAAVFLREPLGWRRLTAILIGFAGVMLIIQPGGSDFSFFSLYALITVACVTLRDLVVRRMSSDVPAVLVALAAAVGVTALGAVGSFFTDMQPVGTWPALYILGATCSLAFGYVFSVTAMRKGEIGFVAPFRYASLVAALILGVVVFGEWPNGLTFLGAGVVVATGLFTLYRETLLRRTRRKMGPGRLN
jgi:S-adenosylmethionine uptake transporter